MPESTRRACRRLPRIGLTTLALAAALAAAPWAARAQSPPPAAPEAPAAPEEAPLIGRVTVMGNVAVDSARILRTFDVAGGTRFSTDAVRRGFRKLLALGLFSDVHIDQNPHDGLIDLTVVVTERPRIAKLVFTGNQKRETSDLEKHLFLRVGETFSPTLAQTQVDSLLKYYRDEGYPRTKIDVTADTLAATNQVNVTFRIAEGEKVRITRIEFAGRTAFPAKRLRKVMKTKTKGFFGGGELKDETFADDREKLETWYHDHGYRDMRVDDFQLKPGDTPKHLTLVVSLVEGRPYVLDKVAWAGNQVVATPELAKLMPQRPGAVYDHARIEKAQSGAYAAYAEHGYLYLSVDPRETVHDDSLVDVTFTIAEGRPSHIRLISITGNKGTREKVIRRELDVHEGDLFRRSALVRSQEDLNRLGIFEEVTPDFTPAESSDVDLVFRVKEKQVGTASAGAGYTNETGLTGFIEIGHSNVLGNGQSLALHLERGSQKEDYELSFTEPWFHDTPTLLGYSAYSTFSQLLEFDQRRRGVSGRIGRPLPWPDYSRGSLSYTLESIEISNVRTTAPIGGIKLNTPELTSTVETSFLRNSSNQAFYPTKGTRLTLDDSFTGGPLGGDLSYHLHRYEGRVYFPSLLHGVTSMARLRIGDVNQYPWRNDSIPDYVRFRLGGGNTPDPLRGYADYQIVPSQFDKRVWTFSNRATVIGGRDTTVRDSSLAFQRYPGGRYMVLMSFEQQFPIVQPLHGVLFFDAGNVWDRLLDIRPFDLKMGAGVGFRMEIPLLGNIGFDYGYGFNRDDGARWQGNFLLGNVGF
ncbi:MAG TPA: outer membrane protein assembly factor BamA [Candidatus Eisenbacteria bacterium]|nr:outer membrane protein assembly factor BamA [Candidatus Eisenbacteria bacterium]